MRIYEYECPECGRIEQYDTTMQNLICTFKHSVVFMKRKYNFGVVLKGSGWASKDK